MSDFVQKIDEILIPAVSHLRDMREEVITAYKNPTKSKEIG